MSHLLKNLKTNPVDEYFEGDAKYDSKGVLKKFYQSEFLDTTIFQIDGLADYGYIYYPLQCIDGRVKNCKVHMHLHGCT